MASRHYKARLEAMTTFKLKPIKGPNNKRHAKKDPIGLHSRWPKPT